MIIDRPRLGQWLLHGAWIGALLGVVGSLWLSVPGALNQVRGPSGGTVDAIPAIFLTAALIAAVVGLCAGVVVALVCWLVVWMLMPAAATASARVGVAMLVALAVPIAIALALTLFNDRLPVLLYLPPVVIGAVIGMLVVRMFVKRQLAVDSRSAVLAA